MTLIYNCADISTLAALTEFSTTQGLPTALTEPREIMLFIGKPKGRSMMISNAYTKGYDSAWWGRVTLSIIIASQTPSYQWMTCLDGLSVATQHPPICYQHNYKVVVPHCDKHYQCPADCVLTNHISFARMKLKPAQLGTWNAFLQSELVALDVCDWLVNCNCDSGAGPASPWYL